MLAPSQTGPVAERVAKVRCRLCLLRKRRPGLGGLRLSPNRLCDRNCAFLSEVGAA